MSDIDHIENDKMRGSFEELSFEHKNKRMYSESTSVLSSSSDENLTDCESSFTSRVINF
jgi:hypothetical protein